MKTLTLFRAYIDAREDGWYCRVMKMRGLIGSKGYLSWKTIEHKRYRQMNAFKNALTKRLQEQEEELELLRMYYGAEKEEGGSELHIYVATDKGKENVELIHSDCAKGDEEGVIGGSQDSQ